MSALPALQLVTPCEWAAYTCDAKATQRVVLYGRSGLMIEDRLLCATHAETTSAAGAIPGYRIDMTALDTIRDIYDVLTTPEATS